MPHKDPEKRREYHRNYMRSHPQRLTSEQEKQRSERRVARLASLPEKKWEWGVGRHYGLKRPEYDRMLADQGGVCAICGTDNWGNNRGPSVDHDHVTGKIRGLLCANCNSSLGFLRDSIEVATRVVQYLRRHKEV